MSRNPKPGPTDDLTRIAGDRGWLGVNMRLEPHQVPEGYMSLAINARFRQGIPETRKGTAIYPWANKLDEDGIHPWGKVYGVGVFKDPATRMDYLIIAAAGAVYVTSAHNTPRQLTLPAGVTITSEVSFTQAFDVMVMHRGPDLPALVMEGIETGFDNITQTADGTGTQRIPNATHSLFFQNRLLIPHDNDEVAASDYGNYTRYLPVAAEFKINQGSSDSVVALSKFNDVTLVVFKEHSIYAVGNVYGDLTALQQDELTDMFGLVARKSVAQVGSDLWFLSEQGVMSLRQTETNKLQSVVLPVSDPIYPLMGRINGRYASGAVAAYHDSRYYLAVPLDDAERLGHDMVYKTLYRENSGGADLYGTLNITGLVPGRTYRWTKGTYDGTLTNGDDTLTVAGDFVANYSSVLLTSNVPGPEFEGGGGDVIPGFYLTQVEIREVWKGINNAVLVYDFLNEAWSGYDQAPGLEVQEWFIFVVNGKSQLFFVTPDGFIKAYEVGVEDALSVPYTDLLVTNPQPDPAFDLGEGYQVFVNWPTAGWTLGQPAPPIFVSAAAFTTPGTANTSSGWFLGNPPSIDVAADNLFADPDQVYGFYKEALGSFWYAPDTLPVKVEGGVRFYASNGFLPRVQAPDWMTIEQHAAAPIVCTLVTRGYQDQSFQLCKYDWLELDLQTWSPSFSVSLLHNGPGEVQALLTDRTKSRTAYYAPFDAPAFDATNMNGDFARKLRMDYSIAMDRFGQLVISSGDVTLDTHQETRETLPIINARGRAAQVKLVNRNGRIRLLSLRLAARLELTAGGTHA